MDVGVLIYLCGIILTATFVLDPIAHALSYSRAKIAMFSLTALLMGMFEITFTPELKINPATLITMFFLMASAVKRSELKLIPFFTSIPVVTSLILLTALYTGANPYYTALVSSLCALFCGISRPSLSMFTVSISSIIAYGLSVVISTSVPNGAYGIFESIDLYNMQAIAFMFLLLVHGVYAIIRSGVKKQAA